MTQFLLQMAGIPGSGKSALASEVGRRTRAVVLDKDAMIASAVKAGVAVENAGGLAYEMGFAMARSLLKAGQSVILDSPANFKQIRDNGKTVAAEAGAPYLIVECNVPDTNLAEARITNRKPAHALHPTTLDGVDLHFEREGTAPLTEPRLTLDTSEPLDDCVDKILAYISLRVATHDQD